VPTVTKCHSLQAMKSTHRSSFTVDRRRCQLECAARVIKAAAPGNNHARASRCFSAAGRSDQLMGGRRGSSMGLGGTERMDSASVVSGVVAPDESVSANAKADGRNPQEQAPPPLQQSGWPPDGICVCPELSDSACPAQCSMLAALARAPGSIMDAIRADAIGVPTILSAMAKSEMKSLDLGPDIQGARAVRESLRGSTGKIKPARKRSTRADKGRRQSPLDGGRKCARGTSSIRRPDVRSHNLRHHPLEHALCKRVTKLRQVTHSMRATIRICS